MIYKKFQNIQISQLALGAMRLPVINGDYNCIDIQKTQKMVDYAIKNGINYFDTAWGYHGGKSEEVISGALRKHPREKYYLADKFPGYDLENMGKVKEIFEKQLERCNVDYFDFYLLHSVSEQNIDAYLDEKYEIVKYLLEQKHNGRIKHLGFSSHGSIETNRRLLDKYGNYMEFCQLQINYIDWSFQNAKEKVELLTEYNIPVWVMEPVRGGKLAMLSDNITEKLRTLRPNESPVSWAFRFLQSIPQVVTILSGMSSFEQIHENIETFSENKPLNNDEMNAILDVSEKIVQTKAFACTSCKYCMSKCPKGLFIPDILKTYNGRIFKKTGLIDKKTLDSSDLKKLPSSCIGCKSCEAVCPQQIKISEAMADFSEKLK